MIAHLQATTTCVCTIGQNFKYVLGTLEGYLYVVSHSASVTLPEIQCTFPLKNKCGITSIEVLNDSLLVGDIHGEVHLISIDRIGDVTPPSIRVTSISSKDHISHITSAVDDGNMVAITDSVGNVRLYTSKDMRYVQHLPMKSLAGVVALDERKLFVTGSEFHRSMYLFDLRHMKTYSSCLHFNVDDMVTCTSQDTGSFFVLGTLGGRCFQLRSSPDSTTDMRCYIPSSKKERRSVTYTAAQGDIVVAGDSSGCTTVLDKSAKVLQRDEIHSESIYDIIGVIFPDTIINRDQPFKVVSIASNFGSTLLRLIDV